MRYCCRPPIAAPGQPDPLVKATNLILVVILDEASNPLDLASVMQTDRFFRPAAVEIAIPFSFRGASAGTVHPANAIAFDRRRSTGKAICGLPEKPDTGSQLLWCYCVNRDTQHRRDLS
jgi:hypothetical protein